MLSLKKKSQWQQFNYENNFPSLEFEKYYNIIEKINCT